MQEKGKKEDSICKLFHDLISSRKFERPSPTSRLVFPDRTFPNFMASKSVDNSFWAVYILRLRIKKPGQVLQFFCNDYRGKEEKTREETKKTCKRDFFTLSRWENFLSCPSVIDRNCVIQANASRVGSPEFFKYVSCLSKLSCVNIEICLHLTFIEKGKGRGAPL